MLLSHRNAVGSLQPAQEVNGLFVVMFVLAYIGVWIALLTPNAVTLALRVADLAPHDKTAALAKIALAGAICSGIANPVFGHLSDICTSRFGRRRPFMVGGMLTGVAALCLIAMAPSVFYVGVGWCITQISLNAALAAVVSILPERIPERLRPRASAFMGMSAQIGILTGTGLIQLTTTHGLGMFLIPGCVGMFLVFTFVLFLKEVPRSRAEVPAFSWWDLPKSFWINPFKYPDFGLVWTGRFLLWISTNGLSLYKINFLIDRFGYTTQGVKEILLPSMAILAATIIIGSNGAGFISNRTGKRKPFVIGAAVLFAIGISIIAFSGSVQTFFFGMGICGLGQGAYMGVDYALVAAVLPNKETQAGKGMGVFNLSSTVAQSFAPVLAPVFLAIGGRDPIGGGIHNYQTFFLAAGFFAVVGAILILFVKHEKDESPAMNGKGEGIDLPSATVVSNGSRT
ncbi:MFS transporter [Collimonas pratensis]|uniref:MFS transporter n=1 Tax=Collimonas pratensis TaxID=279113 RepID=UPI00143CD15B|nr:MFS transporter [Collimonas pratensis]NKI72723.1 MFS transporter [Collimonas pratensis]